MKKFLKIFIIMIILVITYATIVSALSFTVTMEPSSNTIAESTEFTITVKVSNLDVGPNGINTLSGYIKYDNSIFETISETSIEGINGWAAQYSSDVGKVTLTKGTFTKTEETVFNVTLKTKSGVSGKSGLVKFTNILASNSDTEISATDVSTTITVGTSGGNTANVTNRTGNVTPPPIVVSNKTNTSNTNVLTSNTVNNSGMPSFVNTTNTVDDDIPYTGVEDTIAVLIVGIAILAIIFYIKIEKLNNEMR